MGTKEQAIQKLAKRRTELGAEVKDLESRKAELTEQLGRAIIDNANSDKIEGELARVNSKLQGMESARDQADKELNELAAELKSERAEVARAEVTAEYNRIQSEFTAAMVGIVELQYKAHQWQKDIEAARYKLQQHGLKDTPEDNRGSYLSYAFPFTQLDNFIGLVEYHWKDDLKKAREVAKK